MNYFKFKIFISSLNLVTILVGFGLITTIFLSNSSDLLTTQITVPYRAFSFMLSLFTIVLNTKCFNRPSISSILLFTFYIFYIVKMAFTVTFYPQVFNEGTDISMYFLSSICFVLIPSISIILSFKSINFNKVLIYSFNLTLLTLIISILKLDSVFSGAINERINGNIAISTITLGNIGVTLFCFSICIYPISIYYRFLSIFAFFISTIIIIISGSRGPVLSFLVCIIIALFFNNYKKRLSFFYFTIFVAIFLVLSPYIISLIEIFSSASAGRILLTVSEGDTGGRDEYFPVAINQFLKSPFIGGIFVLDDGIGKGDYPHNIFLEGMITFGILGGLVILIFCIYGFKIVYQILRRNDENKWIAYLFIQFFIFSCLSGALWSSIHFIVILSILYNIKEKNFSFKN